MELRNKAVEIANELLINGMEEGMAIASGLKRARIALAGKKKPQKRNSKDADRRHSA